MRIRTTLAFIGVFFICSSVYGQIGNTDYQYALIEAVKQKNLGNLPGSIELYKMVLAENDSVAVAHYELGTLYALMGDQDKAKFHLKTAHAMDPGNHWYLESYVDVLIMNKDFKVARKLLKNSISREDENVDYLYKLANLYFLDGKTAKAIGTLDDIEKNFGISDKIILLKATIYEKAKDYEKAQGEVEKIIRLFPESAEYYIVAAELAMKSKNEDLAVNYYIRVLKLDSTNIYSLTNLTDYYRERKEYDSSFYYLNRSFQNDEIEYDKKMAILSYYLSDKFFAQNYAGHLENLIRTMLATYPEKREIHLFAADFYIQNKKYPQALESLIPALNRGEKRYALWRQGILLANATNSIQEMYNITSLAHEVFPDSSEIVYFKGVAEFELEKYSGLLSTFSDMTIEKTTNRQIRSQMKALRAEAFQKLDSFQISDSLFREIIAEEPQNYLVMNNFSYYLSIRNESLEEAKRISFKVIMDNPGNATFLDTHAWVLYKMKEFTEAEKYINEALKKGGDKDPDINEHAADISKELGNYISAREYYQKAILLGGDKETLIHKLEEIKGNNEP